MRHPITSPPPSQCSTHTPSRPLKPVGLIELMEYNVYVCDAVNHKQKSECMPLAIKGAAATVKQHPSVFFLFPILVFLPNYWYFSVPLSGNSTKIIRKETRENVDRGGVYKNISRQSLIRIITVMGFI